MIKFSVITINYNSNKKLIKTIESVKQQTFKNFEYILIDNNSNDYSAKIIEKNRNVFDIKIIEEDKGMVDALNKGIKKSNGKYVINLHAGDYLESNALERINEITEIFDVDAYFGSINYYNENTKIIKQSFSNLKKIRYSMSLCHTASAIKKTVLHDLKMYNDKYEIAFDYEFVMKLIINNYKIKTDKFIINNMLEGGISSKKYVKANYEEFIVKNRYNKKYIYNFIFFIMKTLISFAYKQIKKLK